MWQSAAICWLLWPSPGRVNSPEPSEALYPRVFRDFHRPSCLCHLVRPDDMVNNRLLERRHMPPNGPEQRIVASANTQEFRPYDRYGAPIQGLSWLPLRFDAEPGAGSYLIRFEPGAASLPHEHGGVEEFVI